MNPQNPRDFFTGSFKKKENSEFEDEYEVQIPTASEVRVIGNKQGECQYYYKGIDFCRKKMIRFMEKPENSGYQDGFLPCKKIVDVCYGCMTENKFGNTLEQAPAEVQQDLDNFIQCTFQKLYPVSLCKSYFLGAVRDIVKTNLSQFEDS